MVVLYTCLLTTGQLGNLLEIHSWSGFGVFGRPANLSSESEQTTRTGLGNY